MYNEATMVEGGLSVWERGSADLAGASCRRMTFQTWFGEVSVRNLPEGRIVVGVPNQYRKEWIERLLSWRTERGIRKRVPGTRNSGNDCDG